MFFFYLFPGFSFCFFFFDAKLPRPTFFLHYLSCEGFIFVNFSVALFICLFFSLIFIRCSFFFILVFSNSAFFDAVLFFHFFLQEIFSLSPFNLFSSAFFSLYDLSFFYSFKFFFPISENEMFRIFQGFLSLKNTFLFLATKKSLLRHANLWRHKDRQLGVEKDEERQRDREDERQCHRLRQRFVVKRGWSTNGRCRYGRCKSHVTDADTADALSFTLSLTLSRFIKAGAA